MSRERQWIRLLVIALLGLSLLVLASCAAPTAAPTTEPSEETSEIPTEVTPTQPARTVAPAPNTTPSASGQTGIPAPTQAPVTEAPTGRVTSTPVEIVPTEMVVPSPELRVLELEWPETVKLGDSDVIRLSLIPSEDGYTAVAEYAEHTLANKDVALNRPEGYTLSATARLDGSGFDISPTGEQQFTVPPGEAVTWRWSLAPKSPGTQRLSILLMLRWQPEAGAQGTVKESLVFDRSMEIKVISFLGMRRPEVMGLGLICFTFSSAAAVWAWVGGRKGRRILILTPDRNLSIEAASNILLKPDESSLMQALFKSYRRLILQSEFMSGYSGARTFLARPVKANGLSDAETIIKIGPRKDIEAEFEHYNSFVKDRLPPITARIQSVPVAMKGGAKAGLQYTCITEPGKSPISLRQALREKADPLLIQRLFDSFGTYWWMQRQPYTFRMAQEYDRLLPPHLVLKPVVGSARSTLLSGQDPRALKLKPGDLVTTAAFERTEARSDGQSLTLFGSEAQGRPVLRVRWMSPIPPAGTTAIVIALRNDLFSQYTPGFDLLGLPDPLVKLEGWLNEVVKGTRSVIHGDLNLENILVGPGNLLWLIDFAQTREGHPLFDFARLASELICHILVEEYPTAQDYLAALTRGSDTLLGAVEKFAFGCQFDPNDPHEYHLALIVACLGALKYQNLTEKAKQYLYLTAAYYGA